jgi:ATP-binding cassette subfamily F protein uup
MYGTFHNAQGPAELSPGEVSPSNGPKPPNARPRKLSYKEQRELEALPGRIDALEQRQATLEQTVSGHDFYQRPHTEVKKVLAQLTDVQAELESAFERWAALEDEG